jgi:AraC family transcriptional regulator
VVLVNPQRDLLGTVNAVLHARARRHESRFASAISVKGVICGRATWETGQGRYELRPGLALLLEDGEEYEVTVDALHAVETCNLFFARGFVEDAFRAATLSSARLLDDDRPQPAPPFAHRVVAGGPLVTALLEARASVDHRDVLEAAMHSAASAIVATQVDLQARVAELPALRESTRRELARRVAIGTAFLHANAYRAVTVAEAASAACLSPFHFHRLFAALHGETPHRCLTRIRLERARAFLRGGDAPVSEVAAMCGFASVGSFTTLFTKSSGLSPARFRRNGEVR